MAQNRATVHVAGNVVKSERVNGDFKDEAGEKRVYDFIRARLLTSEYDTLDVRFPSDGSIPVPPADEQVQLKCEARSVRGDLKLSVLAVSALV